ncbi:MAG: 3-isopropylmalate dehydratase small subunit [Gemmatimonadaceae bacterium]|nr:3-isopropylmalate dehydratase small subunit [Gemmatimonadaceae bacterium]
MPRPPFEPFTSSYVVLPVDDIDTDQITPARFLTSTQRSGWGELAFHDWRYEADGAPKPNFILNRPGAAEAKVLVAGRNFGCGSSREHAVWALMGAGLRCIISTRFADIFRGNALGNGLLPVEVEPGTIVELVRYADRDPAARIAIDLSAQALTLPSGRVATFAINAFAKHCLLHGVDELEFLLGAANEIEEYEMRNPGRVNTRGSRAAT